MPTVCPEILILCSYAVGSQCLWMAVSGMDVPIAVTSRRQIHPSGGPKSGATSNVTVKATRNCGREISAWLGSGNTNFKATFGNA